MTGYGKTGLFEVLTKGRDDGRGGEGRASGQPTSDDEDDAGDVG
ncbi:hypothetical protein ACP70R_030458 [Stipagrostis hirtigluma subsp. patula]